MGYAFSTYGAASLFRNKQTNLKSNIKQYQPQITIWYSLFL